MAWNDAAPSGQGLAIIAEQLSAAVDAEKCHACGCFQDAVASLERTDVPRRELRSLLARARQAFAPRRYDCLGCEVCFPAIADNARAEAFPGEARAPGGPTDAPIEREGWPPLPGDYTALRHGAPVAVCTLNSSSLAQELATRRPSGLAIVGTLHTENLGIERIVRNVLANPNIRLLVICGEDTRQAIGHLPGQAMVALFERGIDGDGRILGARGKRPVLKNVAREEVEAFRRQVELVPLVGAIDLGAIVRSVEGCASRAPGPFEGAPVSAGIPVLPAHEPAKLVLDPAGFLIVYPDPRRGLVLEHSRQEGVLDLVIEGRTASAVAATAVERGVLSRLDHAVYLGRELARAEESLRTGVPYVQDRATEPTSSDTGHASCGCTGSSCSSRTAPPDSSQERQ